MKVKNLYIEKQQEEIEKAKREFENHDCTRHLGDCDGCDKWERINGS